MAKTRTKFQATPEPTVVPDERENPAQPPLHSKPAHQVRLGRVQAAVWVNASANDNKPYYGVSLSRSYKDQNGDWQSGGRFSSSELLAVAEAARLAWHWVQNNPLPYSGKVETDFSSATEHEDIPF